MKRYRNVKFEVEGIPEPEDLGDVMEREEVDPDNIYEQTLEAAEEAAAETDEAVEEAVTEEVVEEVAAEAADGVDTTEETP